MTYFQNIFSTSCCNLDSFLYQLDCNRPPLASHAAGACLYTSLKLVVFISTEVFDLFCWVFLTLVFSEGEILLQIMNF